MWQMLAPSLVSVTFVKKIVTSVAIVNIPGSQPVVDSAAYRVNIDDSSDGEVSQKCI